MRKIKLKNKNSKNEKTEENINIDFKKEKKIITFLMMPIYIICTIIASPFSGISYHFETLIMVLLISLKCFPIIALFSIHKNYKEKRSTFLSWLIIITLFAPEILAFILNEPYIASIGYIINKFISSIYISKLYGKKRAINILLIYLIMVEYTFIFYEMKRTIYRYETFNMPFY